MFLFIFYLFFFFFKGRKMTGVFLPGARNVLCHALFNVREFRSQNYKINQAGRDLSNSLVQIPAQSRVSCELSWGFSEFISVILENLQGWKLHSLSGQPVTLCCCSSWSHPIQGWTITHTSASSHRVCAPTSIQSYFNLSTSCTGRCMGSNKLWEEGDKHLLGSPGRRCLISGVFCCCLPPDCPSSHGWHPTT